MRFQQVSYLAGELGVSQAQIVVLCEEGALGVLVIQPLAADSARAVAAVEEAARYTRRAHEGARPSGEELMRALDARLVAVGSTCPLMATLVWLEPERLVGVQVGDVRAVWIASASHIELTAQSRPGPGLGSGAAAPRCFEHAREARGPATLLVGSPEFFDGASMLKIAADARERSTAHVVAQLSEGGERGLALTAVRVSPEGAGAPRRAAANDAPARPRRPRSSDFIRTQALTNAGATLPGERVLFVDRNTSFVRSVSTSFLSDCAMVSRTSVADALAVADEGWRAILIDDTLDDGRGVALIEALRARGCDDPIIAVSEHAAENAAMLEAGADAACAKMDIAELRDVMASLQ